MVSHRVWLREAVTRTWLRERELIAYWLTPRTRREVVRFLSCGDTAFSPPTRPALALWVSVRNRKEGS